jgi:hypothetical protein
VCLRTAYQDQQAAGLITLEELGKKLAQLDEIRRHAEKEHSALTGLSGARRAARRGQRCSPRGDGRDGAGYVRRPHRNGAQQALSDAQLGGDAYARGLLGYGSLGARLQNGTDELVAVLGKVSLGVRCKFGGRVETFNSLNRASKGV